MKKRLLYAAFSLCIGSSYADTSPLDVLGYAKTLSTDVGLSGEIKFAEDLFSTALSISEDDSQDPTLSSLQQSLSNIESQLTQMNQTELEIKNDIDSQAFMGNVILVEEKLVSINDILSTQVTQATEIDGSSTFENETKATNFLAYLFLGSSTKHTANAYKKSSSSQSFQNYIENKFVGTSINSILSSHAVPQFINSVLEFPQDLSGQLPDTAIDIQQSIIEAITINMTDDVGKAVYWYNLRLTNTSLKSIYFLQQQNLVAQALIILKYKDNNFNNIMLDGLLPLDNQGNMQSFNNLNLEQALSENNKLFQSKISQVANSFSQRYIDGSVNNNGDTKSFKITNNIINNSQGVNFRIKRPTTDGDCKITSFVPNSNSLEFKCYSESDKRLNKQIYQITLGNLINSGFIGSQLNLLPAQTDDLGNNIGFPGIGMVEFTNKIADYDNNTLTGINVFENVDSNTISFSCNSCEINSNNQGQYSTAKLENAVISNENVQPIFSSYNTLYSYSDLSNTAKSGFSASGNSTDSAIIYLPHSGSFIALGDNLKAETGFTDSDNNITNTTYIAPLLNDSNALGMTPTNLINSDDTVSYQLVYNSGESVTFYRGISKVSGGNDTFSDIFRSFTILSPPTFTYKNKFISIGGNWVESGSNTYSMDNINVQPIFGESESNPEVFNITISNGDEIIFDSREPSNSLFHSKMAQIAKNPEIQGVIYFESIVDGKISVVND